MKTMATGEPCTAVNVFSISVPAFRASGSGGEDWRGRKYDLDLTEMADLADASKGDCQQSASADRCGREGVTVCSGAAEPQNSPNRETVPVKHVKKLEKRIKTLEATVQSLKDDRSGKEAEIRRLSGAYRTSEEELLSLRAEHVRAKRDLDAMSRKLQRIEQHAAHERQQLKESEQQVAALRVQLDETRTQLATAEQAEVGRFTRLESFECLPPLTSTEAADGSATTGESQSAKDSAVPVGAPCPARSVEYEGLGYVRHDGESYWFQDINDETAVCPIPTDVEMVASDGDAVRVVRWSDGGMAIVPLDCRPVGKTVPIRRVSRRTLTRRGRVETLSASTRESQDLLAKDEATCDIVIVGGDSPIRYQTALERPGLRVHWHDGFGQQEKLESLLRRAACVITIETKMGHWAFWRVKELAKAGGFVWRHVKVKSQTTVVRAAESALVEWRERACDGVPTA